MSAKYLMPSVVILACTALLMTAGCLDRTEEIVVDEQGNAKIRVEIKGDAADFAAPMALPSEPDWNITKHEIDSSKADKIKVEFCAERTILYGSAMPSSFLSGPPSPERLNLEFPTSLRVWEEGDRTFYVFRRKYESRMHRGFDLSESQYWDKKLEERVIKNGIFKVSEQDRNEFLDQFVLGFAYYNYRFLWTVLGNMVRQDIVSIEQKLTIEERAAGYLEGKVTPVTVLGLLGKDDDSIDVALEMLKGELRSTFDRIVRDVVGAENLSVISIYSRLWNEETARHDLTERFNGQNFAVKLTLPGTIIETNGYIDLEKSNTVEWQFSGEDFHDAELMMHALSVVDRKSK